MMAESHDDDESTRTDTRTLWGETRPSEKLEVDENDEARSLRSLIRDISSTSSITSNVYSHILENGRSYHRYKQGQYVLPNDEIEQDRLDFQHELCKMLLGGRLHLAPLSEEPRNVLDVGTGTGIWAVEFAQQHPECQVLGTDITPIQPQCSPPNVFFEICDAEDEWGFSTPFDLVNMRATAVCFKDPRSVLKSAFNSLRPGGYLHHYQPIFPFAFQDPPPPDCALKRWADLLHEASLKIDRPWNTAQYYRKWMEELGFRDIVEIRERLPLSPWAKGKKIKIMSLWLQQDVLAGMEGFTMALFTRQLGWTPGEVRSFLEDVGTDIRNTSIHAYLESTIIYGRKPFENET